ncbi:MAG: hypothetical protein ACRD1H_01905, partial [Vicinamibacterales bacterium]
MVSSSYSRGWLAAAMAVSATLVLSAPFIGQVRTAIRQAAGGNFATIVAAGVAAAAGIAIVYALTRITTRRVPRYAALAAALVIGVGYALVARTGNPEVDAVERFHFIEYGIITMLFYKAWRPAG